MLLSGGIQAIFSGQGLMIVPGINTRANVVTQGVVYVFSSGRESKAAPGMNRRTQ